MKRKPPPAAPARRRTTKPHLPDEKQRAAVHALAAVGVPREEIATYIGIDADTLRKRYPEELATAPIEASNAIAQRLWAKAKAGDTACMIFWLKARAGWSERQQVTVTAQNALPASVHEFV